MSVPAVQEDWNVAEIGNKLRDPALTYDHYAQLCWRIGVIHQAVRMADCEIKFAVGDAILMGEELFKGKAYQAIEEMGLSVDVRQECVRVASKVPRSVRRPREVHWSKHRAVATLSPPEQEKWLERVSDEQMSHQQLRDEMRNGAESKIQACRCCKRPW